MKKFWILLMICILMLTAGCNQNAETTVEPTAEPATEAVAAPATEPATEAPTEAATEATLPPEPTEAPVLTPTTILGIIKAENTPAVLSFKMRGDQVDVVGEYDDEHYVIKTEEGYGLVRKELIQLESEASYETWTGYARRNAEFYTDRYLTGEPAQKLSTNSKVTVLADLGYCYMVEREEAIGFIKTEQVSKRRITTGGSGGSSSGGSSSGGQDGGDITLSYYGSVQLLSAIDQTGEVTGTGIILVDGTEVVLGYFDRGDEIDVVVEHDTAENKEGYYTVYLKGLFAWVEEDLIHIDGEETMYEAWEGYSRNKAEVYDNFHMIRTPLNTLKTNKKVLVVEELEDCYMVEVDDVIGFMAKDKVSKTRIKTGGTGGSGGSGSSGGSSGGSVEWTPPVL